LTSSNTGRLRALNGLSGLGVASAQVGEAFLEGCDLAEPDIVAGFGEAGLGVGGHLLDASELCWVDAEEAASGAGVFVDARSAVGAVAVAEGDLAQQEISLHLSS
jgi:hypothetical protein